MTIPVFQMINFFTLSLITAFICVLLIQSITAAISVGKCNRPICIIIN